MNTSSFLKGTIVSLLLLFTANSSCLAQDSSSGAVPVARAEGATLSRAVGHYARARTLLVAALREFDQANQMVNPDAVLDADAWRKSLLERTEDLERILDPQPRVSAAGVRFNEEPSMLGEARK